MFENSKALQLPYMIPQGNLAKEMPQVLQENILTSIFFPRWLLGKKI